MSLLWTLGLIVVLVLGWILTLLGMPGTWVIVLAVTVYAALVPADPPADIGWPIPVAVFVLALLAEIGELAAGRASVKAEGASRRGASMAIAGSLVGGLLGMLVGSPIPIVGSLIAAVLFAAVGAIAGSIWGERAAGRSVRRSWTVGQVVFWARISGSLGKIVIATLMVLITVAALALSACPTFRSRFNSTCAGPRGAGSACGDLIALAALPEPFLPGWRPIPGCPAAPRPPGAAISGAALCPLASPAGATTPAEWAVRRSWQGPSKGQPALTPAGLRQFVIRSLRRPPG